MFYMNTLEECECVVNKGGVGSNSTISQLIDAHEASNEEFKCLKTQNAILESKLTQASKESGSSSAQGEEVSRLKAENTELRKQVENLKEQSINDQRAANDRMDSIIKALSR